MADWHIAVPSHARADTINAKTLRTLADHGVPADRVHVFVADDERTLYRNAVDPGLCAEVMPGAPGLAEQRRLIALSYPEGALVVQADDDLADVRRKVDDKTTEPAHLPDVFDRGFAACAEHGATLWGVYPVLNAMFMKRLTRVGLWFCIGQLWGQVVSHDSAYTIRLDQKEDYERTLRHYVADGSVVRLDDVACKSRMYGPGGMQADDQPDRRELNRRAVAYLQQQWPKHVRIAARRSKQVGLEVRLVG